MKIIYISDPSDEKINDMLDYCHSNMLSFVSYENVDVSDVSGQWDSICSFSFKEENDAFIFKLKYAGN
jgi:hypothetical protein